MLRRMNRIHTAPEVHEESEHVWSLSFGDLMTLLLAVFVLIAAMSELREGERFDTVSRSVRAAFGFTMPASPAVSPVPDALPPLLARFEAMGRAAQKPMMALEGVPGVAESCFIEQKSGRLVVRLTGDGVFEEFSATLQPAGQRIVDWLAHYLRGSELPLEIRGICGADPLPGHAPYAGGRDLAYARARHVAEVLRDRGVEDDRLIVSTWNRNSPLAADSSGEDIVSHVDIIVHAVPTATHENRLAEESWR